MTPQQRVLHVIDAIGGAVLWVLKAPWRALRWLFRPAPAGASFGKGLLYVIVAVGVISGCDASSKLGQVDDRVDWLESELARLNSELEDAKSEVDQVKMDTDEAREKLGL